MHDRFACQGLIVRMIWCMIELPGDCLEDDVCEGDDSEGDAEDDKKN